MNKKRLAGSMIALGLATLVTVGGSLAWFTDTQSQINTFSTGKVDIMLTEDGVADGQTGLVFENVMPGNVEDKVVRIDNLEQAAWVRLKITMDGLTDQQANDLIFRGINGIAVPLEFKDSVAYTAQTLLQNGDQLVPFEKVEIPKEWNNEMSGKTFHIIVEGQAVQAENNNEGFENIDEADIMVAR